MQHTQHTRGESKNKDVGKKKERNRKKLTKRNNREDRIEANNKVTHTHTQADREMREAFAREETMKKTREKKRKAEKDAKKETHDI